MISERVDEVKGNEGEMNEGEVGKYVEVSGSE